MARPAYQLGEDYRTVLSNYLRALARNGSGQPSAPSPGHDVRTCPECGTHGVFTLEPEGTWYRCTRCGHYA